MSDAETFILRRLGLIRKLNKANWTVIILDVMESHPVERERGSRGGFSWLMR
jgi:hypothetical protein